MATIAERLGALETVLTASMNLRNRIAALENQIQTFNDGLTAGETQYQFLQTLPDGRCKELDENRAGITTALDGLNSSTKELADPIEAKLSEMTSRIQAIESAIGI